jgi:hypothetical protein
VKRTDLLAPGLALALLSCGGSAPATPAPAPTPVATNTPLPGAGVPVIAKPAQPLAELAVIPVQVTYVLRSLTPLLDSLFPVRDSLAESSCKNVARLVCHQYVYQRDPLILSATGARFSVTTTMRYRARVGVPGAGVASCGYGAETPRRATLSLATDLWTPLAHCNR